jgi:hypothetical protein
MSDIRDLYKLVTALEESYNADDIQLHDSFDIELNEEFIIETGVIGFTEDGGIIIEADAQTLEFLEINNVLLEDQVNENFKKWAAGIALIASLWGVNNHLAKQAYEASPQLQTLIQYHAKAEAEGNQEKIKELERRIANHKTRLDLGKGEVMGSDGKPITPQYEDKDSSNEYNDVDVIELDVPLMMRMLEYAREDAKTDMDLHHVTEKMIKLSKEGPLSMDNYMDIVAEKSLDEAEYQGRKVTLNKPMQGDVKKSKVYVKKPDGKVVKVNFGDKDMRIKKSNPERRKSFRARHNCDNPGPKWKARYWSCRAW